MKQKTCAALMASAILLLSSMLVGQTQPPAAVNQQDEVLNLDRPVSATAESFKILRSGDKAEINRYVTKVYPLKHAHPFEILPYVRGIAALEKGTASTAFTPSKDGNPTHSFIQVNVPEFQIPSIDAAIAAYDVPGFESHSGSINFSYRTKYRNAAEVADFVRSAFLSGDGLIRGDAATNTLYVQDGPSDFRRVISQIQFYDIPVPQIDLEVSIVELTVVDDTSLGLDWDAWKTSLSGQADLSSSSRREEAGAAQTDSSSRGFDGLLSVDATAAARFLNYMVDQGKAKIRARSNMTLTNGVPGTLTSGTQIPEYEYSFNEEQAKSNLEAARPAQGAPDGEGIALAVMPTVAMEGARLSINVALRSPVAIGKLGAPIYSTQRMTADLTLTPEETYKVGGIRRAVEAREVKGIPGLKDVPVIKYLFSNETTVLRQTELYVFVKPRWTSPQLPATDGLRGENASVVTRVENILKANPNLSMSPEDATLLQRYFVQEAIKAGGEE